MGSMLPTYPNTNSPFGPGDCWWRLFPIKVRSAYEQGRMGKILTMRPGEYLIASGGGHYVLELLFGEASRADCAPEGGGSQLDS